jgi:hypothetical protein
MPTPEPEVAAKIAERRYCQDCKFMQRTEGVYADQANFHRCTSPKNVSEKSPLRLVTRDTVRRATFCEVQRGHEQIGGEELCGPSGRWWEAKDA